tara:strand:+ start:38920 stop:40089 length:1170 start_codon:yes stop_codon:yes gene_type:complete
MAVLRPVGSRVPLPEDDQGRPLPWQDHYQTWFMGSGTEALSAAVGLAIRSSHQQGDTPEVILPAYGCPDLVAAIVAQSARPVLVDLLPDRPVMNTEKLAEALSKATVAVIAAGFLGVPERLSEVGNICESHGIWLIEDAAQCFPPDCAREPFADCAVLSFGRGKPINLMGGGALLVRSDHGDAANGIFAELPEESVTIDWKWTLKRNIFNFLLSRFGYGSLRRVPFLGLGSTEYKPLKSIRRCYLPLGLLSAGIRSAVSRPSVAEEYYRALSFLDSRGWVLFMHNPAEELAGPAPLTLRYGLLAPDRNTRDRVVSMLNSRGIGANAFYEKTLPDISGVNGLLKVNSANYPNAVHFADRLLTLPSHEDVAERDIEVIAAVLDMVSCRADI